MLEEVTSDVKVEPALQPLSGEEMKKRSCLLCIRGSRKSNNKYEKLDEISFNAITIVKRNDN